MERYQRCIDLIGEDGLKKLNNSKIAVFGLGGVGSYVCEALIRAGIKNISIIDYDVVDITNINRQIIATNETIGKYKVDVMEERIKSINSDIEVVKYNIKFDENSYNDIIFDFDYIVDAIDDLESKILLITLAKDYNIPIISSMGTANKLDPFSYEITDISKTYNCPLAKIIRKRLKDLNIKDVEVLFSKEEVKNKKSLSTISYMPSIAGLLISSRVIRNILESDKII